MGGWYLTFDKREKLKNLSADFFFNATYKWNQRIISFREMSGIVVTKMSEVIRAYLQTSRYNFINMKNQVPHGVFF